MRKKADNKKKKYIFFWWSASEIICVEFIKYVRMRIGNGREDTNKIGVGVLAKSELFPPYTAKMTENEHKISPYHDIYKTYDSAYRRKNPIKRPTVEETKEFEKLTKKLKHLTL